MNYDQLFVFVNAHRAPTENDNSSPFMRDQRSANGCMDCGSFGLEPAIRRGHLQRQKCAASEPCKVTRAALLGPSCRNRLTTGSSPSTTFVQGAA